MGTCVNLTVFINPKFKEDENDITLGIFIDTFIL